MYQTLNILISVAYECKDSAGIKPHTQTGARSFTKCNRGKPRFNLCVHRSDDRVAGMTLQTRRRFLDNFACFLEAFLSS